PERATRVDYRNARSGRRGEPTNPPEYSPCADCPGLSLRDRVRVGAAPREVLSAGPNPGRAAVSRSSRLSSTDSPLVLLLENVSGVEIEGAGGSRVGSAEFRVAAIADGEILEPPVDNQVDERGGGEDAVGDQVAAVPVEAGADQG